MSVLIQQLSVLTTPYKIKTVAILSSGQKKEINIWGVLVAVMVLMILESKIIKLPEHNP